MPDSSECLIGALRRADRDRDRVTIAPLIRDGIAPGFDRGLERSVDLGRDKTGRPLRPSQPLQLLEAKGQADQRIAIADRQDDPVGKIALMLFEQLIGDGFIALDAEGVAADYRREKW